MTHHDLVVRACRWLKARRCVVIVWRRNTNCIEQPDALGFTRYGQSILIECKTSRGDFFRDRKKGVRSTAWIGVGERRYYLAPEGLIRPEELPPSWGLLEPVGRSVLTAVEPIPREQRHWREEIKHLVRQCLTPDGPPTIKTPGVTDDHRDPDRRPPARVPSRGPGPAVPTPGVPLPG